VADPVGIGPSAICLLHLVADHESRAVCPPWCPSLWRHSDLRAFATNPKRLVDVEDAIHPIDGVGIAGAERQHADGHVAARRKLDVEPACVLRSQDPDR